MIICWGNQWYLLFLLGWAAMCEEISKTKIYTLFLIFNKVSNITIIYAITTHFITFKCGFQIFLWQIIYQLNYLFPLYKSWSHAILMQAKKYYAIERFLQSPIYIYIYIHIYIIYVYVYVYIYIYIYYIYIYIYTIFIYYIYILYISIYLYNIYIYIYI